MVRADIRDAWRGIGRSPAFAASTTLTLALGVGIGVALLGMVRAALFTPLPYEDPGRLVHVAMLVERAPQPLPASYPDYRDWVAGTRQFASIAGFARSNRTLTGFGAPVRLAVDPVTTNFFATLGVPVHGRTFTASEERQGADRVAIVTHAFWRQYLGSSPSALGAFIRLSNVPHEVVGILPESFRFDLDAPDVFVPLGLTDTDGISRGSYWLTVIGRLAPGASRSSAERELEAIVRGAAGGTASRRVLVTTLSDRILGNARQVLLVLLGAAMFVTLSASASVANIVGARAAVRSREFAVRAALGASRLSLWRLAAIELGLVGLGAAMLATFFGFLLTTLVAAALPSSAHSVSRFLERAPIDTAALVSAAVVALVALAPSLLAMAPELLRSHAPSAFVHARTITATPMRRWLVAVQVGVAFVLLIGTALLATSVARLLDVTLGFEPSGLTAVKLSVPLDRYQRPEHIAAFYDELWQAATTLPGVEAAGVIDELPLTKDDGAARVSRAEDRSVPERQVEALFRTAGPGYFETMRIALVAGRTVSDRDRLNETPVVVLSRSLASQVFPSGEAIGRQVALGRGTYQVIGVVEDVRMGELDRTLRPAVYTSALQNPSRSSILVVRTAADAAAVAEAVRGIVARLDGEVPVYGARSVTAIRSETRAFALRTMVLYPLGVFGLLTIVVAALGVHGLLHYMMVQRTREIGVRIALGATPRDVLRLAMRRGLAPVLPGVAAGIAVSLVGSRVIGSLLFEVNALDARVFVAIAGLVLLVALGACYHPARRAAGVDPVQALAAE